MLTEEAIVEQIQADQEMMTVLAIIRDLDLADAWLAAGAVRNFIWNQLSGKPGFDATTDMDLVFMTLQSAMRRLCRLSRN